MANARLTLMEKVIPSHESSKISSLVTKRINSINYFPDELLLKILSYFTAEELCLVIAEVCERWNALAKDVILWENLTYTCKREPTFTSVVKVLKRAPNLRSFVIMYRKDAVQLLELLFGNCVGIKRLEINHCNLGNDCMDVLHKIMAFCPVLEELVLVGDYVPSTSARSTISQHRKRSRFNLTHCKVLKRPPNLKSLEIKERDDAVQLLEHLFDKCNGIKRLEIKFCNLEDNIMHRLDKIVAFYPELEELGLIGCEELTSTTASNIGQLRELSKLNFSHCRDLKRNCLKKAIENGSKLKELYLERFVRLLDDDLIHVISKVGAQLTTLKLYGNELTDDSFCYLEHCTRLQVLDVSNCTLMTDKGLLEGIGALQELRSLSLHETCYLTSPAWSTFLDRPAMARLIYLKLNECPKIDDYGLEGIANRCVHLKTLSLGRCYEVTDAGIMKIICNCKKLQILDLERVLRITGTGYLDLVPTHLPLLKRLNLSECNLIPEELLLELVAAMPQLEVRNRHGLVPSQKIEDFSFWIHWKNCYFEN
ncbi:hypothetical protein L9F63_017103 [Diploptera punctata]|uniref:F-box domain-containing protein n=1 Tax=Diploptera punctata TaxID=6984 RepID=A0AAD8A0R5_DIPPU|nr:hypothetical protein L9F63_017103 [Diploptera punctata]